MNQTIILDIEQAICYTLHILFIFNRHTPRGVHMPKIYELLDEDTDILPDVQDGDGSHVDEPQDDADSN